MLDAARQYDKEHDYPSFTWEIFGLRWDHESQNPTDPCLYAFVIDKDKLLWAMLKYNFTVYYTDSCE